MPSNALQTQESVDTRGRIAEALAELSRAVHKIGMYPPEHPLVPAAIQTVQESVAAALSSIPSLRLGVAKEKILFDGEPLDEKNSALRWIAKCLHGAGIAVLDLTPQAGPQELRLLVSWLYRARRADALASGEDHGAAWWWDEAHAASAGGTIRRSEGMWRSNHLATGLSAGCLRSWPSQCHTRGIWAR